MKNEMNKLSPVKQSVITAVCIALCVVLPMALHSIPQAGMIYSPMHIPALICGLVCSWPYAIACGIIGPVLSSVITGMPDITTMPSMMVELVCYGVVASLLMKCVHTKKTIADVYISLVGSMLSGRIIAGIVKALIFARGTMTITTWATAYFVKCLPGIAIHLIVIPIVFIALEKSNLIPSRYIIDEDKEDE